MTHELAKAIKDNEKMTVVALGTLTNVAALAVRRPDLSESLKVVITCATNDPSDVCVSKDWQALAALLRSPADMTMAPPAPPAAWDDVECATTVAGRTCNRTDARPDGGWRLRGLSLRGRERVAHADQRGLPQPSVCVRDGRIPRVADEGHGPAARLHRLERESPSGAGARRRAAAAVG